MTVWTCSAVTWRGSCTAVLVVEALHLTTYTDGPAVNGCMALWMDWDWVVLVLAWAAWFPAGVVCFAVV